METLDLIKAALAYLKNDARVHGIESIVAAEKVKGDRQECDCEHFDHEFNDITPQFEDDFFGTVYLPLPNGEYMAITVSAT